jgi:hypothetical protein
MNAIKTPRSNHSNKHQYHTRNKIIRKSNYKALYDSEEKEKEKDDQTHLDEVATESMQNPKSWKPFCERKSNNDELELKIKREEEKSKPKPLEEEGKVNWKASRESMISKILWLNYEEASEKRIGKVEMEDGKIAYMYEDILKARYP